MAVFGFRKAKNQRQANIQKARSLRSQQAAPQRPVTASANAQTSPTQKSSPVTPAKGKGRYKQAQANTPGQTKPVTRTPPGKPYSAYQSTTPLEKGPQLDADGKPLPAPKAGPTPFTKPPTAITEEQVKAAAAERRADANKAKAQLEAAGTPPPKPKPVDPNAPQRSTANQAQATVDAAERARLKKTLKAQGAKTPQGEETKARLDELDSRARDIAGEDKPSLNERRARTAAGVAEGQARQQQARFAKDQADELKRASRAGTATAGEQVENVKNTVKTAVDDPARTKAQVKAGIDATKTKAAQGLRSGYQKLQDEALGVVNKGKEALGIQASEAPAAPAQTRTQRAVQGTKNTVKKAGKVVGDTASKLTAVPRAGVRAGKFVATNPGKLALGGGAEALAQFQEGVPLSEIPGNIGTSTVQGLGQSADTLADDLSALEATGQGNLKGDALLSHGARGALNLGEYASDVVGAGLRSAFGPKTFSEAYRENTQGETGMFGRMSAREGERFNQRMNEQTGGDFGKFQAKFGESQAGLGAANELLGIDPNAPAAPTAGARTPPGGGAAPPPELPGSIGGSGFRRPEGPPAPGGGYSAVGPNGSFMTSQSPGAPGGGTYSEVSGPAGPGASVADNVAAYDRQTEAIRGLRNAQREAQGFKPVGQRTFEGFAQTGFGARQAAKNNPRPELDPNLTARQNAYRLASWQAGRDDELVRQGIDPRSGAITGERGLEARFGTDVGDQIAMANFQRQSAMDAFKMAMDKANLGRNLTKDDQKFTQDIMGALGDEDPVVQNQGYDSLIRAFMQDPTSERGLMALQTFGQLTGQAINDERGLIDWVFGAAGWGEKAIPAEVYRDPAKALTLLDKMASSQEGGLIPWRDALSAGGSNYAYAGNMNPQQASFAKSMIGLRKR